MSICSVSPGLSLGMGDLRPFSPLAGFFWRYVDLPHFCPWFPPVPQIFSGSRLSPARSPVSSGSKKQKNSLPAAAPRNRSRCRDKKFPFMQKKPLCIVHNGFFLYPSPNAFSYSSMRRFSSAQYRASSSDMSSRLLFCSIAHPTSSAPARSLLIRW